MYEMTGKILSIGEVQTFNNDFTKREFIIDNGNKYQNTVKFELTKDNCQLINGFRVGDDVSVGFWVNGTEWKDKFFVNLTASEIKTNTNQDTTGQSTKFDDVVPSTGGVEVTRPTPQLADAASDLPF